MVSLFSISARAESVDSEKVSLEWLMENTTRIYSLVSEIEYEFEGRTYIQKSNLAPFVIRARDCSRFDVDDKYTKGLFFKGGVVEEVGPNGPGLSNWIDDIKVIGTVTKRKLDYCFAY